MRRTPWSKQNSSLPSDRIKPKPSVNTSTSTKNKGKGKQQQPGEPPKSKEVERLEDLLQRVQNSTGGEKDPKGGCFCLARVHDLSLYTPICHKCGLILCSTNKPYHSCPHCGRNLLNGGVRETLIIQIETQLASTIAKEIEEKERAIAAAQREAGAFPQLKGPSQSPSHSRSPTPAPAHAPAAPSARQTHKVMSLTNSGSGNKRVLVSSYTVTPVGSRPASRTGDEVPDDEPIRVPPPPPVPAHAERQPSPSRPYENLLGWSVSYVPPSRIDDVVDGKGESSRKKRGNKGKGKEKQRGNTLGDANPGS